MEIEQVEKMENFLRQFRLIKEKYDAVARVTGENFNVFSILGMESREIRHSALLADLLNPKGSHDQGTVFLRLFFEMLREDCESRVKWELSEIELAQFSVIAEADVGGGRIDILIEKNDKCVVIENKIYAGDQERQLGRYYDYAKENYADENIVVIYLTLEGDEASEYTRGTKLGEDEVLRVSYRDHIIKWLDGCLKEVVRIPHIRETLFQYQSLLKALTDQTYREEFIMETNDLFFKNDNHKLVGALEKSIASFKKELPTRCWQYIREAIDSENERDFFNKYVKIKVRSTKEELKKWKDNEVLGRWKIDYSDGVNVIALLDHWKDKCYFSLYLYEGDNIETDDGNISGHRMDKYPNATCQKYLKAALNVEGMKNDSVRGATMSSRNWEYEAGKLQNAERGRKFGKEIVATVTRSIKSFLEQVQ